MKVVFDANVYISFFLTRGKTIASIFSYWQRFYFTVLASPEIIEEIKNSFQYPKIRKKLKAKDIFDLYFLLEERTKIIYPQSKIEISGDPKDNMYLACVKDGQADYLITGDKKHLLPLKEFKKTKIVSPKDFLEVMENYLK